MSQCPWRWRTSRFQTCTTRTSADDGRTMAMVASTAACACSLPSVSRRILWKPFVVFMTTAFHLPGSVHRAEGPAMGRSGGLPARPVPAGVDSRTMTDRRDRKDVLLEAGLTLASELSLPIVLQRIVDLAAEVTDARYGALGVIGDGDDLVEFVTTGMSAKQRRAIGPLPRGL